MVALRDVCQCAPYEARDRPGEGSQQPRVTLVSSGSNTDDCPKQQGRGGIVVVGSLRAVEEWKKRMIICEKPVAVRPKPCFSILGGLKPTD